MDGEAAAMMRTAGILLGSVLMLALFVLVLSSGNHSPPPALDSGDVLSQADTSEPATPGDAAAVHGEERADVPAEVAADTEDAPGAEVDDSGLVLDPQAWNQALRPGESLPGNDAVNLPRYPVWTPFRSHWAAEGFARRLTLATEVPVEVVNETPGHYQVVFRYRDEGERQTMVEQIEAVTGLELE
jgi:hypothetical protein